MTVVSAVSADVVRAHVRSANLVRTAWLRRALAPMREQPVAAFHEWCVALSAAGDSADPILVDPRTTRWLATLVRLVERGVPELLPDGAFRATCLTAGQFAAAARILDPEQAATATTVRIDGRGSVELCGTGIVIEFPRRCVGISVTVAGGQEVQAVTGTHPARLVHESRPVPGFTHVEDIAAIDGTAAVLIDGGSPVVVLEQGPVDLIAPATPGLAVVPEDASPGVRLAHVVAAARHLEFVAHDPGTADVARLHALRECLVLLDEIDGLDTVNAAIAAADRTDAATPPRTFADWRLHWHRAGGTWLRDDARATALPMTPSDTEVLASLGCPHGIEINVAAAGRLRADPTMDHLSLLSVRDPDRYRLLSGELTALPGSASRDLLLAHKSYVDGDVCAAAGSYAELLVRYPYDFDLWRDFTFAIRHLGWPEPGETWLFHPDEVVERATACAPDPDVLGRIAHLSDRCDTGSSAQRFLIGLLEWVAHDHDDR